MTLIQSILKDLHKHLYNRNYIVSNEKLESYGWKPAYSLDMGIEDLLKAYKMIINYNNKDFTNL